VALHVHKGASAWSGLLSNYLGDHLSEYRVVGMFDQGLPVWRIKPATVAERLVFDQLLAIHFAGTYKVPAMPLSKR
jgi:hypothetical protein